MSKLVFQIAAVATLFVSGLFAMHKDREGGFAMIAIAAVLAILSLGGK